MRYLTIVLVVILCNPMFGGGLLTKFLSRQQNNPVESIKQEMIFYLQTIDLKSVTTYEQLEELVEQNINGDIRDTNKFPLFNAFMSQAEKQRDENAVKPVQEALKNVIWGFLDTKSKELKLEKPEESSSCNL